MANKEISIVLRAKNAMAAGLASAKESLEKVGKSALNVGKIIATGFLAGATALAGFAAKALSAYSKQEEAERKLTAALNAHGEAGKALLPMYREIAGRIQDQTGVADELTLATMAQGRTLGVAAKDLEEYAKGVIALKSAGMEGATAQRAMAAAMNGNTEMLTRYLPELRGVTDEAEKQRIVNEFLARGYEQQKEQLQTVGGQWNALKGRVSDVWEELGRAIAQNGALVGVLQRAGDAVKAFGERVTNWMGSGGMGRLMGSVQVFFLDMRQRWESAQADANIFFSAIRDNTVFRYLASVAGSFFNVLKEQFVFVGGVAKAAWETIRSGGRRAFDPPSTDAIKAAYSDLAASVKGQNIEVTNHLQEALAKREKMEQRHAQEVANLSDKISAKLKKEHDERVAAAEAAAAAEREIAEKTSDAVIEEARKTTDELKAEHDKRVKDAKEAHRKEQKDAENAQRARIKAAEEELKKQQDLAKMRVDDFVAAQRAERDENKERAREARQMQELEGRIGRGAKLSRRQMDRLEAFRQIQAAQERGVANAEQNLKMHQDALEQLQQDGNRKLDQVIMELKNNHKTQLELLKMG